ncbi:hypothetical protein B0H19DRAFT_1102961 [Mycena capillaripes]|nr:hypothetical protein B0H19DRAFT_1102961 [Mycena capillaripes]
MEGGSRKDSEEMITAQLELVKIWFSRSGDCPLSLSLTNFSQNCLFLPRFLETVVFHCQRWEYFVLYTPIKHLHLIQDEMPFLRKLILGPSQFLDRIVHEPVEVFLRSPKLESVTVLQYFLKAAILLPWVQLTHFDAHVYYEDESMEILRDATHPVYCRLCLCQWRSDEASRPSFSVVHLHLYHFALLATTGAANRCRLLDN